MHIQARGWCNATWDCSNARSLRWTPHCCLRAQLQWLQGSLLQHSTLSCPVACAACAYCKKAAGRGAALHAVVSCLGAAAGAALSHDDTVSRPGPARDPWAQRKKQIDFDLSQVNLKRLGMIAQHQSIRMVFRCHRETVQCTHPRAVHSVQGQMTRCCLTLLLLLY